MNQNIWIKLILLFDCNIEDLVTHFNHKNLILRCELMVQMRHQSTHSLKQAKVVFSVEVSNGISPSFWLIRKGKLSGAMAQPLHLYQSRSLSLSHVLTHIHSTQHKTMQHNSHTNVEVRVVILPLLIIISSLNVSLLRWFWVNAPCQFSSRTLINHTLIILYIVVL